MRAICRHVDGMSKRKLHSHAQKLATSIQALSSEVADRLYYVDEMYHHKTLPPNSTRPLVKRERRIVGLAAMAGTAIGGILGVEISSLFKKSSEVSRHMFESAIHREEEEIKNLNATLKTIARDIVRKEEETLKHSIFEELAIALDIETEWFNRPGESKP